MGEGFRKPMKRDPMGLVDKPLNPSPWATLMATLKWTIHLMTCLWMCNGNSCSHKLVHSSTHSKCVLPESIHNPPMGVGWVEISKVQEIPGERGCLNFFQFHLNFQAVVLKVSFFAFPSRVANAKKINLVNLKHEMNIFVLAKGSIFCRC